MFIAINFILIAVLCAWAVIRELRNKNLLAVAWSGVSLVVFGWFGIMTLVSVLAGTGGAPTGH